MKQIKAALFDLDGVILDTEPQYTLFWNEQGRKYLDNAELGHEIKGMSLSHILHDYFGNNQKTCGQIKKDLEHFEESMNLVFIPGVQDFLKELKSMKIKTAVVTSSSAKKMESVYKKIPGFKSFFDRIFTAEDYPKSKPAPDCYITGAEYFKTSPEETLVFEDSVNGLISGKDSGMILIGLATTNPPETVSRYTNWIINDFVGFSLEKIDMLSYTTESKFHQAETQTPLEK